ncbi:glycosyltransferase [Marivirga harenae]|uniref:glycosyltransferase n=1 Tax=Marivirga harenae TaxID=2010992 RepID=UPI0026DFA6E2|nr:glycosyltransferase [Marivirga harenae]WKV10880.1 glycosyltransferase [Marivirga harenae]|tara:strand:- start:164604 stop:165674 length:1071 start_codon:yes stop_codon:yes gene_type:complete
MKPRKILFICPYPFDEAPSQRFRYEQYLNIIKNEAYAFRLAPFLNLKAWKILYKSGNSAKKIAWLIISFIKRFLLLFQLHSYEFIFIHREASPVGPPFFEWIVRFIWRKKIIYDFDDAIWLEDPGEKGSLKAVLKWKSKVRNICKWSYKVSCGNEYLAEFAKKYNDKVVVNPTTIDTTYHRALEKKDSEKTVIGWTGTHSTLQYLKLVLPVLDQLSTNYDFELLVISNQKPDFDVHYMRFIPWSKRSEIEDLNKIDIGIMPLSNDIWSQGKCGFKLLQYMAVKKPIVGSPVGVNEKLLTESRAGYSATNEKEWTQKLSDLIEDYNLRNQLGKKGREYVEKNYSVLSNKNIFLGLMK